MIHQIIVILSKYKYKLIVELLSINKPMVDHQSDAWSLRLYTERIPHTVSYFPD